MKYADLKVEPLIAYLSSMIQRQIRFNKSYRLNLGGIEDFILTYMHLEQMIQTRLLKKRGCVVPPATDESGCLAGELRI